HPDVLLPPARQRLIGDDILVPPGVDPAAIAERDAIDVQNEIANDVNVLVFRVLPRPGQEDAVVAADAPRRLGLEFAGLAVEDLHAIVRRDDDLRLAVAVHVVDHERWGVLASERTSGPDQLALVGPLVEGEAIALAVAGVHSARIRNDLQTAPVREQ